MKVNGKDYPISYIMEKNTCLKPPTSCMMFIVWSWLQLVCLEHIKCYTRLVCAIFTKKTWLNHVKSAYSHHSFWMSNPRPSSHRHIARIDASEETLRHFGRPQMYPAPAQSTRQQLRPAWSRRWKGRFRGIWKSPQVVKKNKSTAKSLFFSRIWNLEEMLKPRLWTLSRNRLAFDRIKYAVRWRAPWDWDTRMSVPASHELVSSIICIYIYIHSAYIYIYIHSAYIYIFCNYISIYIYPWYPVIICQF